MRTAAVRRRRAWRLSVVAICRPRRIWIPSLRRSAPPQLGPVAHADRPLLVEPRQVRFERAFAHAKDAASANLTATPVAVFGRSPIACFQFSTDAVKRLSRQQFAPCGPFLQKPLQPLIGRSAFLLNRVS